MKAPKFFMLILLSIGISLVASAQQKSGTDTAVFKTNATCHSCVNKIEKNIPYEKGVKDVSVNLETKEVTITYNTSKTDKEKLKKSLEKLNMEPQEVVAEKKE